VNKVSKLKDKRVIYRYIKIYLNVSNKIIWYKKVLKIKNKEGKNRKKLRKI